MRRRAWGVADGGVAGDPWRADGFFCRCLLQTPHTPSCPAPRPRPRSRSAAAGCTASRPTHSRRCRAAAGTPSRAPRSTSTPWVGISLGGLEGLAGKQPWAARAQTNVMGGKHRSATPSFAPHPTPNPKPPAGWGLAAVTSRAFRVRGPSHPASLLPLVDMANHSFEPNAEVVPGPGGGVVMLAKREVRRARGWGVGVAGACGAARLRRPAAERSSASGSRRRLLPPPPQAHRGRAGAAVVRPAVQRLPADGLRLHGARQPARPRRDALRRRPAQRAGGFGPTGRSRTASRALPRRPVCGAAPSPRPPLNAPRAPPPHPTQKAGAAVANVMDGASFLELDPGPTWKRRILAELRLAGPGADLGVQVGRARAGAKGRREGAPLAAPRPDPPLRGPYAWAPTPPKTRPPPPRPAPERSAAPPTSTRACWRRRARWWQSTNLRWRAAPWTRSATGTGR
jgi:hypothetical protein